MNQLYSIPQFNLDCPSHPYFKHLIDLNRNMLPTTVMTYGQLYQFYQFYALRYYQQHQYLVSSYQFNNELDEDVYVKSEAQTKEEFYSDISTGSQASYLEYYKIEQDSQTIVKTETSVKQEIDNIDPNTQEKANEINESYLSRLRPRKAQQCNSFRPQLNNMVLFFVTRFELAGQEEIERERQKYMENESLIQIFDILNKKYAASGKTREDMTRSVMRKAIIYLRDKCRYKKNLKAKDASIALSKSYFADNTEDDAEETDSQSSGENYLALLPYKKNSIDKTPNMNYISKIFSSKEFCSDYESYLKQFDDIIEKDNQKRIQSLIEFLDGCLKQDDLLKITKYPRLPWPDAWVGYTKRVACELFDKHKIRETSQTAATEGELKKKKRVKKQ